MSLAAAIFLSLGFAAALAFWQIPLIDKKYRDHCQSYLNVDLGHRRLQILVAAMMVLIAGLLFGFYAKLSPWTAAALSGLASLGLVLSLVDMKFHLIPDRLHLMGLGLVVAYLFSKGWSQFDWTGFALNYGILIVLVIFTGLYQLLRKKEGLGLGDLKLLFWITAALPINLIVLIMWANFIGLLFLIRQYLKTKTWDLSTALAFGPCLYLPFFLSLLF